MTGRELVGLHSSLSAWVSVFDQFLVGRRIVPYAVIKEKVREAIALHSTNHQRPPQASNSYEQSCSRCYIETPNSSRDDLGPPSLRAARHAHAPTTPMTLCDWNSPAPTRTHPPPPPAARLHCQQPRRYTNEHGATGGDTPREIIENCSGAVVVGRLSRTMRACGWQEK